MAGVSSLSAAADRREVTLEALGIVEVDAVGLMMLECGAAAMGSAGCALAVLSAAAFWFFRMLPSSAMTVSWPVSRSPILVARSVTVSVSALVAGLAVGAGAAVFFLGRPLEAGVAVVDAAVGAELLVARGMIGG